MARPPDPFQHPAVRELAWTIQSPPLLDPDYLHGGAAVSPAWCARAFERCTPWLAQLDQAPKPLQDWLAARPERLLGRRFEHLIEFWLRHDPGLRLLAAQAQVRAGERVLGEFDFLFLDAARGQAVHWEAAVKFYLRHQRPDGGVAWLGPNPRDTLEGKLRKVFRHQLTMAGRPEAQPLLGQMGVAAVLPEAYIKGYLFYPAEGDWRHPALAGMPPGVSPRHLRGWWTRAGARSIPQNEAESTWQALERLAWLAPARQRAPGQGRDQLEGWLEAHFGRSHQPVLLAELVPAADGTWCEASRGFVVPDRWPGLR